MKAGKRTVDNFGSEIRRLRRERKMTIRQLELYSGVSNGYLSQLETGKRGVPSPDIIRKLSEGLRIDYHHLMRISGYVDEEKKSVYGLDLPITTPEQREFIGWVKENLTDAFFYDFDKSPEGAKRQLIEDLRYMWEREKKRQNAEE